MLRCREQSQLPSNRCPHFSAISSRRMRCALLPGLTLPGESSPMFPCPSCKSEWIDGQPPTTDNRPSSLDRYAVALDRRSMTDRGRKQLVTPERLPVKRPCRCDHAGRILTPSPGCCSRIYACDIHGQATCGPAQPGVTRCQECGDFEDAK